MVFADPAVGLQEKGQHLAGVPGDHIRAELG